MLTNLINTSRRFINVIMAKAKPPKPLLFPSQQYMYHFDAKTPSILIASNDMLVREAAVTLALAPDEFNAYIKPLLEYLAKYCMLLPASKAYHHKEPGSFFYHLLETGNIAAKLATSDPRLLFEVPLEQRRLHERFSPLAAFLGGIAHDIAKPLSDFKIILYDASLTPINTHSQWQPDEETLFDHCVTHSAAAYQVVYHNGQYDLHDAQQLLYLRHLLSFFPSQSQHNLILKKLLPMAVQSHHALFSIIKDADRQSTRRDTLRYKPFPVVKSLAKAFIDIFQDFDRINRTPTATLPYFFSDIGIHLPYPDSMHFFIQKIIVRFKDYIDGIPQDPDAWVQVLGKEHSVLIANHASSVYTSTQYTDIEPFVHLVEKATSTSSEDIQAPEMVRVITLSYEAIFLMQRIGSHHFNARFATSIDHDSAKEDSTSIQQDTIRSDVKNKKRKKQKNSPKVSVDDPAVNGQGADKNAPEPTLPKNITAVAPPPIEGGSIGVSTPPSPDELDELINQSLSDDAVLVVGEPIPETEMVPSDVDSVNLDEPQVVESQLPQNIPNNTKLVLRNSELQINVFVPEYVQMQTVEQTVVAMASQLPPAHLLSCWIDASPLLKQEHATQLLLILLFNDIQQYSFDQLLEAKSCYRFCAKGFGVSANYFEDAISYLTENKWPMYVIQHLTHNKNSMKSELKKVIFKCRFRSMLVFQPDLATLFMYDNKPLLQDAINREEVSL